MPPRKLKKVFLAVRVLDMNLTGFQRRQQWRVARRYADLAHVRRREHHRCLARMNFAFGGNDVDVN